MRGPLAALALTLAVPFLGWSSLMALDARHADEERALDAQCQAAIVATGIEPTAIRYPDIDRVCGPLFADAIAASRTHGPIRDTCLGVIGARDPHVESPLRGLCVGVFPISAWTGEQRLLRPLRSTTTAAGAVLLAIAAALLLTTTLRGPRCLEP